MILFHSISQPGQKDNNKNLSEGAWSRIIDLLLRYNYGIINSIAEEKPIGFSDDEFIVPV